MTKKLLTFVLLLFSFAAYSDSADDEQAAKERIFKQFGVPKESKVESQPEPAIEETNTPTKEAQALTSEQPVPATTNQIDPSKLDIKKIEEMAKKMTESSGADSTSFDSGFLGKMMNDQMKSAAAQMIKSNPFKMMSDEDVKSMVVGRFKPESPIGNFFTNNPKAVDGIVAWVKDEKAIPSFISIINKPEKMKYFGYSVLAVFVIAFLVNLKNSQGNILKKIVFKIVMMMSTAAINLGVFYFLFSEELQPSIDIILKYI